MSSEFTGREFKLNKKHLALYMVEASVPGSRVYFAGEYHDLPPPVT